MADIRRIVDLYELYDSYRKVARELNISRNTVKKYVHRVEEVQDCTVEEILPKDRKINQPPRVLTETVRKKIHQYKSRSTSKTATHCQTNPGTSHHGRPPNRIY